MRTSRRQAFILALSLTAGLLALTAPHRVRASAYNYITNGGFESGVESWTIPEDAKFDIVGTSETSAHEGTHVGRITLSGVKPFPVSQTSWLTAPAGSYHISVWILTKSATTNPSVQVIKSPTNRVSFDGIAQPNTWQHIEGNFDTFDPSNIGIAIGGVGTDGDIIYVDDVQLVGAEPVTPVPLDTQTTEPTLTPPADAASTRTPAATKTVTPTKTPRATNTPTLAAVPMSASLSNSGFESSIEGGLPTSWRKYGGVLRSVDAPVRNGEHAAQLESASTSTKWLFQNVLVDGGGSYEFGAWIADDDPGVAAAFLRVSWYASDDASGTALDAADSTERLTSPASEYRHLTTGSIAAPADAHSARLRIMLAPVSAAPATMYADDASFGPAAPADPAAGSTSQDGGGGGNVDDAAPPIHPVLGESTKPRAVHAVPVDNAPAARIVINEVMYDPDGAADPAAAEWVELYNAGNTPVSLAGWSLTDAASNDTIPSGVIESHGYVVVAASDSFRTNNPGFTGAYVVLGGRIGNSLGNHGDRLILRDASGATTDAISWGTDTSILKPAIVDVPSGHSIERRAAGADHDLASDFVDNLHPSPGGPFVANAARQAPKATSNQPQALPGGQRSLDWLIWAVSGLAAVAFAVAVAWRVAPALSQRMRRQA